MAPSNPLDRAGAAKHEVREETLGEMLLATATATPEATALIEASADRSRRRRWTYTDLVQDVHRVASLLVENFEPGERLAIWSQNCVEWEILEFAAAVAGLVVVPVNPSYGLTELRYVLEQSGAAGVAASADFRGRNLSSAVRELQPELPELRMVQTMTELYECAQTRTPDTRTFPILAPSAPAIIQYTSGTTGFPKGAVLSHRAVVNTGYQLSDRAGVDGGVFVSPMPMFHIGGLVAASLTAVSVGAANIPMAWDPSLALELIESEHGTVMGAVPTMLRALRQHADFPRRDLGSLQLVLSGGAPVAPSIVRMVETDFDARCVVVFGQTESCGSSTATHPDDSREDTAATVGRALPLTEVATVDLETGEFTSAGVPGEVVIRGVGNMIEYFRRPKETAETVRSDGWLRTGDLGVLDERGYLTVTGRLKEMIIRGGQNIYPREIEDLLHRHQGITHVAVIGVPDDYYGEEICAYVCPAGTPTIGADELAAYAGANLAPHKVPRYWRFVDALPVTASGKVQKFRLRELFAEDLV